MRFIIGVDARMGLATDLERVLRSHYCISEFQIIGISCGLRCTSTRMIAAQVDCILEALMDFPARYFVGISSGRVIKHTRVGPVPYPITIITAIDPDGVIHADRIQKIGYPLPWEIRKRSSLGEPDLIDVICTELVGLVGTLPEPILLPPPDLG